jgi:hypothetical protein
LLCVTPDRRGETAEHRMAKGVLEAVVREGDHRNSARNDTCGANRHFTPAPRLYETRLPHENTP